MSSAELQGGPGRSSSGSWVPMRSCHGSDRAQTWIERYVYGLVNQGLQDFVVSVGGAELWRAVRTAADVDAEMFVSGDIYPDAMTAQLVDAAGRVLDMPTTLLLRRFGKHWILYTARRGYGAIFDTMGRTLVEFLTNLDMMHTRLSLGMPELRPPSFVCEPFDDGRIRVEYRSDREGFAPMVIGLLEGLAEMYGLEVAVRHTAQRSPGRDHDEFVLEPMAARSTAAPSERRSSCSV